MSSDFHPRAENIRKEKPMSYRTTVNDVQIFGNNEYYPEWIEFIQSQNIKINDDGCYDGEITDVMGAIEAIEKIILRLEKERRDEIAKFKKTWEKVEKKEINDIYTKPSSLFDMSIEYDNLMEQEIKFPHDDYNTSLTDRMIELRKNGYIFMSCLFIDACEDMIEKDRHFSVPKHFNCYKIKDGCKIRVHAG